MLTIQKIQLKIFLKMEGFYLQLLRISKIKIDWDQ